MVYFMEVLMSWKCCFALVCFVITSYSIHYTKLYELSPQAADRLDGVTIHRDVRGWDKPSDHVPVEGRFAL